MVARVGTGREDRHCAEERVGCRGAAEHDRVVVAAAAAAADGVGVDNTDETKNRDRSTIPLCLQIVVPWMPSLDSSRCLSVLAEPILCRRQVYSSELFDDQRKDRYAVEIALGCLVCIGGYALDVILTPYFLYYKIT